MWIYAIVFLMESAALLLYYYSWDRMQKGARKWPARFPRHGLECVRDDLLFLANSWVSFMMSPAESTSRGVIWEMPGTQFIPRSGTRSMPIGSWPI